jgi:hypothetical protein
MITMTTIVPIPMNMGYVLSPCPPLRTELTDPCGPRPQLPRRQGFMHGHPAHAGPAGGIGHAGGTGISYVLSTTILA